MIQEYFSQSPEISTNQSGVTQFLGGTHFTESLYYFVHPSASQI